MLTIIFKYVVLHLIVLVHNSGIEMSYVLHLFPFSNFCEKARWAFDYLDAEYEITTHYPGSHAGAIKKLSGQTAVPVLQDHAKVIFGSAAIIQHVMKAIDGSELLPKEYETEILEWQRRLDEIGATIRGALFYDILAEPSLAIGLLTDGQKTPYSMYGLFFRMMIPMLRKMLRDELPSAQNAREKCLEMLTEIDNASRKTGFLVGDHFTLADLTAASMFYPICMPEHSSGYAYAHNHPGLNRWFSRWEGNETIPYILKIYKEHRNIGRE